MRIALPVLAVIVAVSFYKFAHIIPTTGKTPLLTSNSQSSAHTQSQAAAKTESASAVSTASSVVSPPLASKTPSASANAGANSTVSIKVDFATQIRPILETKCQPCHFSGGKVYDRLPFDRPETIKTLGTKLFTRIKDEDERRVIREFLAQN